MSLFTKLNAINVSDKIEKKNNLSYLSWAYAWGEINKHAENVKLKVYENSAGFNYHHDTRTAWVKVGVEAEGIEHIEYLPIMDYRNKSIDIMSITSMDVNKAIQRAGTKAIARHGLGLYIYAGEDLPEEDIGQPEPIKKPTPSKMTAEQRKEAYNSFKATIENNFDFGEWCEYMNWDMESTEGKKSAFTQIVKFLNTNDLFEQQISNFRMFLDQRAEDLRLSQQ